MGQTGQSMTSRYYDGGLLVQDNVTCFSSAAASTVANSVAATSIINSTGAFGTITIPANFLQVGSLIELRGNGSLATDAVAPTLTVVFKFGSAVLSTSGAVTFLAQVTPACLWEYSGLFRVLTVGGTGTCTTSSIMWINNLSNNSFGAVPSASVTIDTTASQLVDVQVTWGTASANNTITGSQWFMQVRQ